MKLLRIKKLETFLFCLSPEEGDEFAVLAKNWFSRLAWRVGLVGVPPGRKKNNVVENIVMYMSLLVDVFKPGKVW